MDQSSLVLKIYALRLGIESFKKAELYKSWQIDARDEMIKQVEIQIKNLEMILINKGVLC